MFTCVGGYWKKINKWKSTTKEWECSKRRGIYYQNRQLWATQQQIAIHTTTSTCHIDLPSIQTHTYIRRPLTASGRSFFLLYLLLSFYQKWNRPETKWQDKKVEKERRRRRYERRACQWFSHACISDWLAGRLAMHFLRVMLTGGG